MAEEKVLTAREQELAKEFTAIKDQLRYAERQAAIVLDLNKCVGCQLCSVACKTMWTREEGREYMWWNTVNTVPGKDGYGGSPKDWERMGGGYKVLFGGKVRHPLKGKLPSRKEFGDMWKFNYEEVAQSPVGKTVLRAINTSDGSTPDWSMNWDEDQGGGIYPNAFYFYLPRICNHCTYPACLDACPRNAIYKRPSDGTVQIDQERCKGYRFCLEACPYKKIYFNFVTKTSMKCIFCYPRNEQGVANACVRQCAGRVRFLGFLDDKNGPVYKLVKEWKVALPLHPEYGTEPNVYYIPPIAPHPLTKEGKADPSKSRIPTAYLRFLFGPEVDNAMAVVKREMAKTRRGEKSELMEILIAKRFNELLGPFTKDPANLDRK